MSDMDNRSPGSGPQGSEPADPRIGRISETHEEEVARKSHDYTEQALMNESGDGPLSVGLAITSAAATASAQDKASSRKEKERRERFQELLRLLEKRIDWLGGEIDRLSEEIEQAEQEVATMEGLMDAIKSGRELSEEEQRLAERYRDENGEIDMEALAADIEDRKRDIDRLKVERDDRQLELDDLQDRKAEVEGRMETGGEFEPRDAELAIELGVDPASVIVTGYADGNEALEGDMASKMADLDAMMGSHAKTVSDTTIKASSARPNFNSAASGETPPRLEEERIMKPEADLTLR